MTNETLEDILQMWHDDTETKVHLGNAATDVSRIQSKYLKIIAHHNLKVKKLDGDLAILRKYKWLWIAGKLSKEEYKTFGWPLVQLSIPKTKYMDFVEADQEVINLKQALAYHQEIVETCKAILKELTSRTFALQSAIAYEKFLAGG